MYGARAKPIPVICHDKTNGDVSRHSMAVPLLGMCFMTPSCDLKKQVTCHRYEGRYDERQNMFVPYKTARHHKGTYKHYSSIFFGNMTDSFV